MSFDEEPDHIPEKNEYEAAMGVINTPETNDLAQFVLDGVQFKWVPADFARKLERQRNELLEALEKAVERLARYDPTGGQGVELEGETLHECRAAIDKAKGE